LNANSPFPTAWACMPAPLPSWCRCCRPICTAAGRWPTGSTRSCGTLLRRHCLLRSIDADEAAFDYLINDLHRRTRRPLLAAWPQELLCRIADFAGFAGRVQRFDVDSVAQAWSSLFGSCAALEPGNLGDAR